MFHALRICLSVQDGVYLFKPQTMSWLSSGVARDWPDSRAVYVNNDKTLFAWINQKDHLRFVSWSSNNAKNDLRSVITRFSQGIQSVNIDERFSLLPYLDGCCSPIDLVGSGTESRRRHVCP